MIGISPAVGVNGNDRRFVRFKAGVTAQRLAETIGLGILLPVILFGAFGHACAQESKAKYPNMAAPEQYRITNASDEIGLARSAAPASISNDADILVLGNHGYETAVKGKNGFVCVVERSWAVNFDDPQFWNPKIRAPICFNAASAGSVLPPYLKRTEWVLAGVSKSQIEERVKAVLASKAAPEPAAMCYMLSKQGYLNDADGHWHPHVMFFFSRTEDSVWGANLPGSPVLAAQQGEPHTLTTIMIPVLKWSDGKFDTAETKH